MVVKETTIVVRNDTRERLKMLGQKGQTYDQLINQLLNLKGDKTDSIKRTVESLKPSKIASNIGHTNDE